jgi:hypothetical protein
MYRVRLFFSRAVSMLRMRITKQSFLRHRLKIRCVANMYGIYYKSHEKSVEPEKKRHHHYVATTTNPLLQWELTEDSESVPKVRCKCSHIKLLRKRQMGGPGMHSRIESLAREKNKKTLPITENIVFVLYRVIINYCNRSKPCPCYEIFAALYKHNSSVA